MIAAAVYALVCVIFYGIYTLSNKGSDNE
ncbi:hypothetical protein AND4_07854 [Vibrio sp. AND4]|nr:hypothetical protein AND4_07854 [Vibrio sp. AND4]